MLSFNNVLFHDFHLISAFKTKVGKFIRLNNDGHLSTPGPRRGRLNPVLLGLKVHAPIDVQRNGMISGDPLRQKPHPHISRDGVLSRRNTA